MLKGEIFYTADLKYNQTKKIQREKNQFQIVLFQLRALLLEAKHSLWQTSSARLEDVFDSLSVTGQSLPPNCLTAAFAMSTTLVAVALS